MADDDMLADEELLASEAPAVPTAAPAAVSPAPAAAAAPGAQPASPQQSPAAIAGGGRDAGSSPAGKVGVLDDAGVACVCV